MKITVWTASQSLVELSGPNFETLDKAKAGLDAKVTIQNTSSNPVYIDNGIASTTDWSYMLWADRQVEFTINNLARLFFIAGVNSDIRIITS